MNNNYAPAAPAECVLHGLTAQRAGVLGSVPPKWDPSFVDKPRGLSSVTNGDGGTASAGPHAPLSSLRLEGGTKERAGSPVTPQGSDHKRGKQQPQAAD